MYVQFMVVRSISTHLIDFGWRVLLLGCAREFLHRSRPTETSERLAQPQSARFLSAHTHL